MTTETTTTTIPAGWKLVPIDPTPEMVDAACKWNSERGNYSRAYAAMVDAAPSPAPAAPSARFATPDNAVAELWRHLPKTPAMWETVEPLSAPPLWLYEAMDKALTLLPAAPSAAQGWDAILKAARTLPSLKGITLTSQDPMAQARWLTTLGDLQKAVAAYDAAPGAQPAPALEFGYTNWRGEYARRRVQPIRLYHGSTKWHPEPQWLMEAYDADKGGLRAFAVKDMVFDAQPSQGGSVSELVQAATALRTMVKVTRCPVFPEELEQVAIVERFDAALSAARASAPAAPEKLDWLPTALVSRAGWGERTKNDSYGTSRLLRQVAHFLETGAWVDDIERAAGEEANG